jgi:hypothetical protein
MALSPQTTAAVIDAIVGSRPKALGLDLASLALVRADEVIEVVVSSPTHPRCCDAGRPIGDARVPRAIGQSFDWFVPAEAEVLGARVADRPAAFPLAELEQRASASVVDRDVFRRRLRPPEHHHRHLMLGEDVQARTL